MGRRQKELGVDRTAVGADLEVEMGTGRHPGRADPGDGVALENGLTQLDVEFLEMGVERGEPMARVENEVVAVAVGVEAGYRDQTHSVASAKPWLHQLVPVNSSSSPMARMSSCSGCMSSVLMKRLTHSLA